MTSILESVRTNFFEREHFREGGFFYLKYLTYESSIFSSQFSLDPHTRLTYFHLAIVEQIGLQHFDIAYEIYRDLISKKDAFILGEEIFKEELNDIAKDITTSLKSCGFSMPVLHF